MKPQTMRSAIIFATSITQNPMRGKWQVNLVDGRNVVMPISAFPCLKKVPVCERSQWYLMGGGVTWDSCPEVIHVEQILGDYQKYGHEV